MTLPVEVINNNSSKFGMDQPLGDYAYRRESHAISTPSTSFALCIAIVPLGYNLPMRGYNFALSSLERYVPNELTVILIARRSASKARISSMMVSVGEGNLEQKC